MNKVILQLLDQNPFPPPLDRQTRRHLRVYDGCSVASIFNRHSAKPNFNHIMYSALTAGTCSLLKILA